MWLLQVASPNGRIARWQCLVSEFDFDISHIPGSANVVADFLSRMKIRRETEIDLDDLTDAIEKRERIPLLTPVSHKLTARLVQCIKLP